jgi:hypothetical protein
MCFVSAAAQNARPIFASHAVRRQRRRERREMKRRRSKERKHNNEDHSNISKSLQFIKWFHFNEIC